MKLNFNLSDMDVFLYLFFNLNLNEYWWTLNPIQHFSYLSHSKNHCSFVCWSCCLYRIHWSKSKKYSKNYLSKTPSMDWNVPKLLTNNGWSCSSWCGFQWTLLLEIKIISLDRRWSTYGFPLAIYLFDHDAIK